MRSRPAEASRAEPNRVEGLRAEASPASAASSLGSRSFGLSGGDRFSLLLLEDGEYYFRDHACYFWKDGRRVFGHLKVCSMALYFVPRDIQEAVFRVPYKSATAIEALEGETQATGEGMFVVSATERIDMKAGDVHRPYQRHQGEFRFQFSLVYTSLEDVLPAIEELCILAQQDGTKEERAAAKQRLTEIIQEHEDNERFNPGWLEDDNERVLLEEVGSAITALCTQPGRVVLTQNRIYFQPFNVVSNAPIQTYQLDKVLFVMRRVYQLEDLGVEVFFPGRASLYLTFKTTAHRERFIKLLMQQPNLQLEHMHSREKWTRDWVSGRISNFDYLMYLNREAGRSFKDLTQYPVFPWVIADYTSATLDLNDPTTFRDLSRPIGALNPERLKGFRERFVELKKLSAASPGGRDSLSLDFPPPFLYGCHYSSPGYVVFYLMRSDPQLMLRLQNGRFDAPDRLFWSIQDTWKSVLSLPTDVKELVPEFYSNDASFLLNNDDIDFGRRANGQRVGDVVLPPWATDAQDFVYKLAEALESPFVSSKLHKWINLVFGYKSRGAAAEAADNVFHYLTYDEIATKYLEQERDPVMREALRLQMMEFGRTPRQLFTKRHPKRRALGSPLMACLACAPPTRKPAQPVNTLLGKGWAGRNITPVSRAVFKLTSKKATRRAATLAWLESAAANHEPGALALKQGKGAELVLLVKFVRDAREGRNPHASGEEMTGILVRACKALAVAPQNRRYMLDAGALDLLIDAMCSGPQELSQQALQVLAAICKEDDPRLASVERRALAKTMDWLRQPPHSEPVLAALTIVAHLARGTPNRTYFTEHGLLPVLVSILDSLAGQVLGNGSAIARGVSLPPPSQQQGPQPQPPASPGGVSRLDSNASGLVASAGPGGVLASPAAAGLRLSTRRSTTLLRPHTPRDAADTARATNLRQCTQAVAALLQDDAQKDLMLASGSSEGQSQSGASGDPRAGVAGAAGSGSSNSSSGSKLDLILQLARQSEQVGIQGAAYECLAALTMYDPMRQQVKERALLPSLLQTATSGPTPVQRPAAEAVASVCAGPQLVVGAVGEQGLASLVAMALSPDQEVQRHAARALWHLVAQPDTRTLSVRGGALTALLSLAHTTKRGVQARSLARRALRVCYDDTATRPQLEAAAAAAGVDMEELTASFTSATATGGGGCGPASARVSSHPSFASLHPSMTGVTPSPGSTAHFRAPSDMRSDEGSASPLGGSRFHSFTAGLGQGVASQEEDASTPKLSSGSRTPRRSSPFAADAAAAAAALGRAQAPAEGTPAEAAEKLARSSPPAAVGAVEATNGAAPAVNGRPADGVGSNGAAQQALPLRGKQLEALELAMAAEAEAGGPLPLISPITVPPPSSSSGSSPRQQWEQRVQQQQQQAGTKLGTRTAAQAHHSPPRSPSGKVADAVRRLESRVKPTSVSE